MLAKLLKTEWKSTAGMMGLLSAAAVGVGIAGGCMVRYMVTAGEKTVNETLVAILSVTLAFMMLALFAYVLGGELYLGIQFYKRKFTDIGYLTFTLPVRSWQIFLSSLINIMIWTLIIGAVLFVAFGSIFLIGLVGTAVGNEMFEAITFLQTEPMPWDQLGGWGIISYVLEFISGIVVIMTCITVGAVLAKRRKILCAIAVFYVVSLVLSAIWGVMIGDVMLSEGGMNMSRIYMISSLINLVLAAGGTVLSCWLMEKKLNLP